MATSPTSSPRRPTPRWRSSRTSSPRSARPRPRAFARRSGCGSGTGSTPSSPGPSCGARGGPSSGSPIRLPAYWEVALEPHWPRVRALLEADLLYRSRRLTEGGPTALFADLDPAIHWRGEASRSRWPTARPSRWRDGGSCSCRPSSARPFAIASSYWQPTVMYPARGVALLWEGGQEAPPEALAAVLGRGRAAVLLALDAPRTTGDVARRLEISRRRLTAPLVAEGGGARELDAPWAQRALRAQSARRSARRRGRGPRHVRALAHDVALGAHGQRLPASFEVPEEEVDSSPARLPATRIRCAATALIPGECAKLAQVRADVAHDVLARDRLRGRRHPSRGEPFRRREIRLHAEQDSGDGSARPSEVAPVLAPRTRSAALQAPKRPEDLLPECTSTAHRRDSPGAPTAN